MSFKNIFQQEIQKGSFIVIQVSVSAWIPPFFTVKPNIVVIIINICICLKMQLMNWMW